MFRVRGMLIIVRAYRCDDKTPICARAGKLCSIRRPCECVERATLALCPMMRPPGTVAEPEGIIHSNREDRAIGTPGCARHDVIHHAARKEQTPVAIPHLE